MKTAQYKPGERRAFFSAILLLFVFFLPALLAVALPDAAAEASLPACCRAHGKHHCSMGMLGSADGNGGIAVHTVHERCPYAPASVVSAVTTVFAPPPSVVFAELTSPNLSSFLLPADAASQEQHPANPKRGPPVSPARA